MKKSLMTLTTVAVVGLGTMFVNNTVQADTITDLKSKQSEVHNERSSIKANLSDAEAKIADVMIELVELNEKIEEVNKVLKENQKKMDETKKEIEDTKSELKDLEEEIDRLEKEIEERYEILKDRIVSYQKTGGNIGYLDVIFGSSNFGEFISRVSAVNKITNADAELMEIQEKAKEEVVEKQNQVERKLKDLNDMKLKLEQMQTTIVAQKEQVELDRTELKNKKEKLQKLKESLQVEDSKLAYLEAEISQRIKAANSEVEKKVTQSIDKNNSSNKSNNNSSNLTTLSKEEVSSQGTSELHWPTIGGYISSRVGMRWGSMHKGMDIARPSNYAILAADNGVVVEAGYSSSFGNKIVIDHNNGMRTLYAHLSSIGVRVGQTVGKGSQIGIMGTTGDSTGVHLHFEVHVNGAIKRPSDYF